MFIRKRVKINNTLYSLQTVIHESHEGTSYLGKRLIGEIERPTFIKKTKLKKNSEEEKKQVYSALLAKSSPHLAKIVDLSLSEKTDWIVQEWIEGVRLSKIMKERKEIPLVAGIFWIYEICLGLVELQKNVDGDSSLAPLVHNDLSPVNIMITASDLKAVIIDFERTHFTNTPLAGLGNLAILAPELKNGSSPSLASDVYSLGLIAKSLLGHVRSQSMERFFTALTCEDPTERVCNAKEALEKIEDVIKSANVSHLSQKDVFELKQQVFSSIDYRPIRLVEKKRSHLLENLVSFLWKAAVVLLNCVNLPFQKNLPPTHVAIEVNPWAEIELQRVDSNQLTTWPRDSGRVFQLTLSQGNYQLAAQHPILGRALFSFEIIPENNRVLRFSLSSQSKSE